MCGFIVLAGAAPGRRVPHDLAELDRLRDTLRHRGPDDGESWIAPDGSVACGHRRLKVIDLEGGRQPMADPGERYRLVYNGEIYNYRELRGDLERHGLRFHTASDTEVLLAAWMAWGEDALPRLRGIFAFAIWDAAERRLFAARDPLGVKPLYWAVTDGLVYLASEPRAIVADPRMRREIDPVALDLYFHHGYVPAPWTIWRGVRKLAAGHSLLLDLSAPAGRMAEPRRYHEIPFGDGRPPLECGEAELLDRLDDTLRRAVRRQTVSDVPLGAFLSGGVDSSLVVSYLAEIGAGPLETFSVGYPEERFDERPWARAVAERLGTRHHEIELGPAALDRFDELMAAWDEPLADPAALPTAVVSELARRHVTVVLSGDGGDETHAGYPRYLDTLRLGKLDVVPAGLRRAALGPLARSRPSYKRRGIFEQAVRDAVERHEAMTTEVPWHHRRRVYTRELAEALEGAPADAAAGAGAPGWRRALWRQTGEETHPLDRLQYLDLTSALPERLMVKLDRATMRVGLEGRVPLLDLEAIELAASIPARWRIAGGRPKYLLRRLLARRLGAELAERRKHGFRVPEVAWLRALGREGLRGRLVPEGSERWLDRERTETLLLDEPRGLELAWPFLAFAAWYRVHGPGA